MDHITKLVDIYSRWLDNKENHNVDKVSASEALWGESLTVKQTEYLERFIYLWDKAELINYSREVK
jgi:hypothetical protein